MPSKRQTQPAVDSEATQQMAEDGQHIYTEVYANSTRSVNTKQDQTKPESTSPLGKRVLRITLTGASPRQWVI
jgi:hypothetical protein